MCITDMIYLAQHYLLEQRVISSIQCLGTFKLNCPSYNQSYVPTLNESLKVQIDENIRRANCVVVLIDKLRCRSELLHYEIETALRMRKMILGIEVSHFSTARQLSGSYGQTPASYVDSVIEECVSKNILEEIRKKIKVYEPFCLDEMQSNFISWINKHRTQEELAFRCLTGYRSN